jgi:phosphoglycolate phosphatase
MDLLIFDLDGTLVDSKVDLINSVNATRLHMGLSALPDPLIAGFIGRGAPALIRSALGDDTPQQEVDRALDYFLGYYREHMLDETRLYPGVAQSLDKFQANGIPMAILTNKPVKFSQLMMQRLNLFGHFLKIYGGNSFEQKKPHPIGIETLLAETGSRQDETLMIGDSSVDIRTARNAGVACCGVTYGFQPETFTAEPPDFTVDHMEELVARILG